MYYFAIFIVILGSSHLLAESRHLKKRIYSDSTHTSVECKNPHDELILDDDPALNAMTSDEYIAHYAKVVAKAVKNRRMRKLKRRSKNDVDNNENDHNDGGIGNGENNENIDNNVNKNINRNVNGNINKNVKKHKNRHKGFPKQTSITTNNLEVIHVSGNDGVLDNHNRVVNYETNHPRRHRKIIRHHHKYLSAFGKKPNFKKNISLEVEGTETMTTPSTTTSSLSTTASDIDAENTFGDINNNDQLRNIVKNKMKDHHQRRKKLGKRKNHDSMAFTREDLRIREKDRERNRQRQRGKNDHLENSEYVPAVRLLPSYGDESIIQKDQDYQDDLLERNKTIPELRRLFPKFKKLGRIRGPRWSGSDLLMYAIDTARSSSANNNNQAPVSRILQDQIDSEYLPEMFKPTNQSKIIHKGRYVNKTKNVEFVDDVLVDASTQRPRKKHRIHFASTIGPPKKNDTNGDEESRRSIKKNVNQNVNRNVNQNVNRNVNVNVNKNGPRHESEESNEETNLGEFGLNKNLSYEDLESGDTETRKHKNTIKKTENINKNVNINRNSNRRRLEPHELTQEELDSLLENYEDKENRGYGNQPADYY